jgi:hypothetical protein
MVVMHRALVSLALVVLSYSRRSEGGAFGIGPAPADRAVAANARERDVHAYRVRGVAFVGYLPSLRGGYAHWFDIAPGARFRPRDGQRALERVVGALRGQGLHDAILRLDVRYDDATGEVDLTVVGAQGPM